MSPEQATNTAGILAALEGLYFEDTASVERFADPGYWETLADHRLHCSHSIAAELVAARAAVPDPVARGRAAAREQLSESGFAVLTAAEGGHPAGLFDAVQVRGGARGLERQSLIAGRVASGLCMKR